MEENLNWELNNNRALELMKIILLLGYRDLSFQLKHCFLYHCISPEDHEIDRKRVVRHWMPGGFSEAPEVAAES